MAFSDDFNNHALANITFESKKSGLPFNGLSFDTLVVTIGQTLWSKLVSEIGRLIIGCLL